MKFFSVQKLLALSLIVFLSGTCCLLCCDLTKAAAVFGAAESCPLSKTHHCPHPVKEPAKPEVSTAGTFNGSAEQTRTFCPFISRRGDLVQNVKSDLKFTAVAAVKIAAPPIFFVKPVFAIDKANTSFIRDRGGTYLANCVFRI